MTIKPVARGLRRVTENVRIMIDRADTTQSELGRTIGLNSATMSRKMTRHSDWTFTEAQALASALDITLDELAGDLPTYEEWVTRRRGEAPPTSPGPRYLVMPDRDFDARRPPLSRPEDLYLIGALIVGLLRMLLKAIEPDRVALPHAAPLHHTEPRRPTERLTSPICPVRLTARHSPRIPLPRSLPTRTQDSPDCRPRAATIPRRRHIQHHRTL